MHLPADSVSLVFDRNLTGEGGFGGAGVGRYSRLEGIRGQIGSMVATIRSSNNPLGDAMSYRFK